MDRIRTPDRDAELQSLGEIEARRRRRALIRRGLQARDLFGVENRLVDFAAGQPLADELHGVPHRNHDKDLNRLRKDRAANDDVGFELL